MNDQTDKLLSDLLATQKRILEIEEELLANSRLTVQRQRRAFVWFVPIFLLILLSPYIPWAIARIFDR